MKPSTNDLTQIPGVGKSIAHDLSALAFLKSMTWMTEIQKIYICNFVTERE